MADKTHFTVTLDVYAVCDHGIDSAERLAECGFIIDPEQDATDEVMDIQDITVAGVKVEDSR